MNPIPPDLTRDDLRELARRSRDDLVVIDPDGWACVHRAACQHPNRADLVCRVRPTDEAEADERNWPRCRTCKP